MSASNNEFIVSIIALAISDIREYNLAKDKSDEDLQSEISQIVDILKSYNMSEERIATYDFNWHYDDDVRRMFGNTSGQQV